MNILTLQIKIKLTNIKNMKFSNIILLGLLFLSAQMPAFSQKENKPANGNKETKLTVQQRLTLMTRELNLTTEEQSEVRIILSGTQFNKEKIKALNLPKKEEKARINKIKDIQKAKLRKILGTKRYAKYQKLKKEDVF